MISQFVLGQVCDVGCGEHCCKVFIDNEYPPTQHGCKNYYIRRAANGFIGGHAGNAGTAGEGVEHATHALLSRS